MVLHLLRQMYYDRRSNDRQSNDSRSKERSAEMPKKAAGPDRSGRADEGSERNKEWLKSAAMSFAGITIR